MIVTKQATHLIVPSARRTLLPSLLRRGLAQHPVVPPALVPLLLRIVCEDITWSASRHHSSTSGNSSAVQPSASLPQPHNTTHIVSTTSPSAHQQRQGPVGSLLGIFKRPQRRQQQQRRAPITASAAGATAGPSTPPHTSSAAAAGIAQLGSALISFLSSGALTSFLGASAAFGLTRRGLKRLAARRSARRRALPMQANACSVELSVVTFNVRGVMDRWAERAPLLSKCLEQLDADVVAFQEVLTGEFGQDQRLLGPSYSIHECRAALAHLSQSWGWPGTAFALSVRSMLSFSPTRSLMVSLPEWVEGLRERYELSGDWARLLRDLAMVPFFGNSIATRLPLLSSSPHELLMLGDFRAAQRVCLRVPASGSSDTAGGTAGGTGTDAPLGPPLLLWLVNTHLDHAAPEVRAAQGCALVAWMEGVKESAAAIVITGDLNAPPHEELHRRLEAAGYWSASKAANGKEPERTWPTGLVAPLMDKGEPHCADYVYVWQAPGHHLAVLSAELHGNVPAESDATLYPSDHAAIKVRLRVGRK